MNNKETVDHVDQMHGYVEKLFYIPAQMESGELKEFLEDLRDNDFKEIFGIEYPGEDIGEIKDRLYHHNKLGYVAECRHPKCSNFSFDENNKPTGWSVSSGHCVVFYAYGDTMPALLRQVKKESLKLFKEDVKAHRPTNKKPTMMQVPDVTNAYKVN